MGADRVEVAKQDDIEISGRRNVSEDLLRHVLGPAVGALRPGGGVLRDRDRFRLAIDRARRLEDDLAHTVLDHVTVEPDRVA